MYTYPMDDKQAEQWRLRQKAAADRFEQLHHEGARRFGTLWLTCNRLVSDLRFEPYVPELPESDRTIDALLSECAWILAEQMEKHESMARENAD